MAFDVGCTDVGHSGLVDSWPGPPTRASLRCYLVLVWCTSRLFRNLGQVVVSALVLALISCTDPSGNLDNQSEYVVEFVNSSSYEITVSDSSGSDFEPFTLKAGGSFSLPYKYSSFLETIEYTHASRVDEAESKLLVTFTDKQKYPFAFTNNSSYAVTVSDSSGDNFDAFSVLSGTTKTVYSTSTVDGYSLSANSGIYSLAYDLGVNTVTIYQYQYFVEYRISGNTSSVDVTLSNSAGGTEQYSSVALPHSYTFDTFAESFLYVSAQNNYSTGTVTVEIYLKGKQFKTSTSSGAYVIATASGSR